MHQGQWYVMYSGSLIHNLSKMQAHTSAPMYTCKCTHNVQAHTCMHKCYLFFPQFQTFITISEHKITGTNKKRWYVSPAHDKTKAAMHGFNHPCRRHFFMCVYFLLLTLFFSVTAILEPPGISSTSCMEPNTSVSMLKVKSRPRSLMSWSSSH